MASFTNSPRLTDRYADALQFAFEVHQHQIRKQGEVPYISHLMQVSSLVLEAEGTEGEAIAALLHDAIEDGLDNEKPPAFCADASGVILFRFGLGVLQMIQALSEDKSLPAEERKNGYVEQVKNSNDSVILISFMDKLHNLRSYATDGRSLWKCQTAEFYDKLMPIYFGCDRIPKHLKVEMLRLFDELTQEMGFAEVVEKSNA